MNSFVTPRVKSALAYVTPEERQAVLDSLERARMSELVAQYARTNPGKSTAPCYSIDLGWFMTNISNPPTYHATEFEALAACAKLIETGNL